MTTTVIVQAHCASNKKVDITMKHESGAKENFDLEDGETQEFTVYDLKEVSVREVVKIYKVTTGEREIGIFGGHGLKTLSENKKMEG